MKFGTSCVFIKGLKLIIGQGKAQASLYSQSNILKNIGNQFNGGASVALQVFLLSHNDMQQFRYTLRSNRSRSLIGWSICKLQSIWISQRSVAQTPARPISFGALHSTFGRLHLEIGGEDVSAVSELKAKFVAVAVQLGFCYWRVLWLSHQRLDGGALALLMLLVSTSKQSMYASFQGSALTLPRKNRRISHSNFTGRIFTWAKNNWNSINWNFDLRFRVEVDVINVCLSHRIVINHRGFHLAFFHR